MSPIPTVSRRDFIIGAIGTAVVSAGGIVGQTQEAAADTPAQTIKVFASMTDGAVIELESAGAHLIGNAPGLAIRPEGDVYIVDRERFLDALPFTLRTSGGSALLTLDPSDYLDQEHLRANCVTWFDAADQRSVLLSDDGITVEEWDCRADPARRARNDIYPTSRPTYVTSSQSGADHPAVRCQDPSSGAVYGLFFEASPVYYGLQALAIETPTTFQIRMDNDYNTATQLQPSIAFPAASTPAPVGDSLNVFVGWWTKDGRSTGRLNGREVASQSGFDGRFDYDGFGAAVFYAAPNSGNIRTEERIVSGSAIGNAYTWAGSEFTGDLFEWWSLLDAGPPA